MYRKALLTILLCALAINPALADPITYSQVSQGGGLAFTRVPLPPVANDNIARTNTTATRNENSGTKRGEFLRMPDGRIVKNGPGLICAEGCVEAVPLVRSKTSRSWYIIAPVLAAGVLCAVLCRGGSAAVSPLAQATVVIQPSPSPTVAQATPTPGQPPSQVPEPGTLGLLGLGISALLAKRRMSQNNQAE